MLALDNPDSRMGAGPKNRALTTFSTDLFYRFFRGDRKVAFVDPLSFHGVEGGVSTLSKKQLKTIIDEPCLAKAGKPRLKELKMSSSFKTRIGAVSYLNTKPLIESLTERCGDIELSLELPSRLAAQLVQGELDVALVPSLETFRMDGAKILSDACIGCRGPVWSVKIVSRVPFEEITTLALDEGSRTSVGLAQVLLQKKLGICPIVSSLPIDQDPRSSGCDAVLVIGDRAMQIGKDDFPFQWDLGDQWCRWTELPFVFAMWVTLDESPDPEIIQALSEARDFGVNHVDEIARREAGVYNLSFESCREYLKDNLHFQIGEAERRGLELFQRYLFELNLIPETRQLDFYEHQNS